jgi:hypothetical protein
MPTHKTHKKTDLEQKLKIVNQQLYGKSTYSFSPTEASKTAVSNAKSDTSDVAYLKIDLTKIIFLAGLAIGAQFLIYTLIQNKIIALPFLNF